MNSFSLWNSGAQKSAQPTCLSCSKKLGQNERNWINLNSESLSNKWSSHGQHHIEFVLHSSESAWGRWKLFLVFMPFCYSASWPCLVSRRVLLSSLWVSLFFLKVLAFFWSRHCCRVFDVSRGDGSESSPVSFHVSLKVDFEPVSVKLGLIATTGSAHTHKQEGKTAHFPTVTQRLLLYAEE